MLLGLGAAVVTYLVIKLVRISLGNHLAGFLQEAIYSLPWLVGGFVAGCKSRSTPLKNGAVAGTLYGLIFCLIGMALISGQAYGLQEKLSQLGFTLIATLKFALMFSLASAFGFVYRMPNNRFRE